MTRVDAPIPEAQKALFERAADLAGYRTLTEFLISSAQDKANTILEQHHTFRLMVEMQCIDRPVYLYWFTLSQQGGIGPGGSVMPDDPPTNITPVTLGYFTTQTRTIVVE